MLSIFDKFKNLFIKNKILKDKSEVLNLADKKYSIKKITSNDYQLNIDINKNFVDQIFIDKNVSSDTEKKEYKRILACGDIHGNFAKLLDTLSKVRLSSDDFIIFLGDYTDRGPDNKNCMKFVVELYNQPNVVFLIGNHEEMLLECFIQCAKNTLNKEIESDNDILLLNNNELIKIMKKMLISGGIYSSNGGDKTLYEINLQLDDDIQLFKQYMSIVWKLKFYYSLVINDQTYIFVHAGINPIKPFNEQDLFDLIWIRYEFLEGYRGDYKIVVGHTPTIAYKQTDKPIFLDNNIIMCDTGSYHPRGRVSIIDVLTQRYWQSFNDLEYQEVLSVLKRKDSFFKK